MLVMLLNKQEYDSMVWEVASIIKLVTTLNIKKVCNVASNIAQHYDYDEIDNLDDEIIYEAYIKGE